jgi:hypothetical protein
MRKKIPESVSIICGTILTIIPYFQQGNKMNMISWILVVFGISGVLFGVLWGIFKPNKPHTYPEMLPIMKQREQDLPEVKKYIAQYISRSQYLAENNKRLYDLDEYKRAYFKDGIKGIRKYNPQNRMKLAYYWELYQREKIWEDNAIYRSVRNEDETIVEALTKLNYYLPIISDKKLRKCIRAVIKYSQLAYSEVIWFTFGDVLFDAKPSIRIINLKRKQFIVNMYHDLCSRANKRIEELLSGAEDL